MSAHERYSLLSGRYDELMNAQRQIDQEIDEKVIGGKMANYKNTKISFIIHLLNMKMIMHVTHEAFFHHLFKFLKLSKLEF